MKSKHKERGIELFVQKVSFKRSRVTIDIYKKLKTQPFKIVYVRDNMRTIIEVLDKKTNEILFEEAADVWLNPLNYKKQELSDEATLLKPKTFNKAYNMLMDMLQGEIYQNVNFAVRLKGVKHKWEW